MRRYRSSKRCRSYDRTLVAVYLTADAEGLISTATNGDIAKQAGLAPDTVKQYLRELERAGVITIFRPGIDGVSCRLMVLLDHRDAKAFVRNMRRSYGLARPRQGRG